MSNPCPYTGTEDLVVATEATRPRPANITIMKSQSSGYYSAKHVNGKIYPLEDRTDVDSDVVLKIIDNV